MGDRIWMARFTETGQATTPALGAELYPDFAGFRVARVAEDASIEAFLAGAAEEFLAKEVRYVNSAGEHHADPAGLLLAHLFNHQTHHRGQVHVMLSQTAVRPPALDMHQAIPPEPESRMQASGRAFSPAPSSNWTCGFSRIQIPHIFGAITSKLT